MKLKFYMRGLGVGILVTTIIFSFSNKKEKLSDKEVIAKARELGMIMKEEDNPDNLETVLEKTLDKEKSKQIMADGGQAPQSDSGMDNDTDLSTAEREEKDAIDTEINDEDNAAEQTASADDNIDSSEDTGENDTVLPEDTGENDIASSEQTSDNGPDSSEQIKNDDMSSPEQSGEDNDADVTESDGSGDDEITFTIVRGMSSGQVAELLFQQGLVEDATAFDNYIKQMGKANVIRIGTYTLPKDTNHQEILKRIAG